jgi:predicted adenylyl cyclase CyaB
MAKETEVKFRVAEFESIRRKLRRFGARCVWGGREESRLFDTARHALKTRGESLRIKRESDRPGLLTFKGPRATGRRFKVREEIQTSLSSPDAGEEILKRLGYTEQLRYTKRREHWEIGAVSIELDVFQGMRFVEVEGKQRAIRETAKLLGLDWGAATTASYPELLRKSSKQ